MEIQGYRRTTRVIGVQVAAVSAALVLLGAALAVAYMFWQTRPAEVNGPLEPGAVRVFLDPADLVLGGVIVGLGAVVCAGGAAWLIAHRAVRPLEEAARMQQRFVADASHELRTPLAVLNARLQQLALLTPAGDPRHDVVGELRGDARVMSGIVDDMLAAAAGTAPRSGSCVLEDVMGAAVADLTLIAERRGVRIALSTLPGEVGLPSVDLRRCLVALLDNAVRHSPDGGTVVVAAVATRAQVRISVSDGGAGIIGIDAARVFERFAHGATPAGAPADASAAGPGSRASFGIGLALVAELAERHGGGVRVASTGPTGTTFELTVPRAPGGRR
ncbi:Signal transduction histidine kinase [Microbacterium azadirachtae]|uniref:histidine kinase n=1 Tax=Microbacterium azadirachtae TaxID=582680 RepID=A0A1I6HDY3_9MICO|nr:HAMP domain-containing sensor histidine kinase [Microbacterium azadirachtae]SFR52693.1 Signal transduction histidine kinase [Microbacterium azadirachtae]